MKKYVKITDDGPIEYTFVNLKRDNPNVSFPLELSSDLLSEYNMEILTEEEFSFDDETQTFHGWELRQDDNGNWIKSPLVKNLTQEELDIKAAEKQAEEALERERAKRKDYADFSDPLYFKWKAGETTEQEWLDARNTVKGWYD